MDSDAFALLTGGGVRFDKKRFAKQSAPAKAKVLAATQLHGAVVPASTQAGTSDQSDDEAPSTSGGDGELDPGCPNVQSRDVHEADNAVRKHYLIKVMGYDPAPPLRSFQQLVSKLGSPTGLLRILREAGYQQPTPIQRQAIPILMAGRELLAVAPTGSGKTLAFLLPIVSMLRKMRQAGDWPTALKAVVLSPTNELAAQQARCLKMLLPGSGLKGSLLSKATAAGTNFSKVDILLANPLRLLGMIEDGKVDLKEVRVLVLDEADKLFELGFMEQVDGIIAACSHKEIVRALFSATLPEKVEELARSVLQQPLRVTVGVRNSAATTVKQRLLFVGREAGKLTTVRQLLREGLTPPVLIFVASKDRAKSLHRELMYDGLHVDSIHSEQSHAARSAAVDNFRLGRTWVLIATDLIGRGMDFVAVKTVINYDFPNSTADYVHRIGRTGRAGQTGEAVTFFTEDDAGQLRSIANLVREAGGDVPDWMTHLSRRDKDKKRARLPPSVLAVGEEPRQPAKRSATGKSRSSNKQMSTVDA